MNKLFRLAIVQGHNNGAILRLAVLVCMLGCLQTHHAFACRYNVRETGFVDLRIEPYYLFGCINDETDADVVSRFKQVAEVGLENSNVEFEIINIDQQKDHPAMKLIDLQVVKSLPAAVLVSPDGQSYFISLAERDRPFEETLRSALEDILSSPKREEILRQVIKTYGVVLLIEGTDDQENIRARKAASDVIELISSQMEMMPKPIAHPPVLIVMDRKSLSDEEILLWSLGLDGGKLSEPHAAVLYGRSRWMGPLFKGEEIDENNLASVLFVIGADCECGFDYRWLQGTMLPARWTDKMQEQVAESLGFDPENPMIKMEISSIIRRGSYSYPGVPFGYQELVVEPDPNTGADQNSINEVEDTSIPDPSPDDPISEPNPSIEQDWPFRNTILILVGLCVLVLTSGIVILVRAKKNMNRYIAGVFFLVVIFLCGRVSAEDWPTYGRDIRRSCVTSEQLELPLKESWVFKAAHPPQPAWPAPAKQDFFHRLYNLRPTVTYDQAFGVVGAGDIVCFGSSADDKIYALDSMTGQIRWTFFTEGPVRLAPTVSAGRVYVGSDDGCVYCLSGDDGSLVWKYRVTEQNRMVPGNGRMISMWPVRAGFVADEGKVYFTAGLFPTQGTYLCAINAENGAELWKQKVDISPQGYMLASDEQLYVPTGRTGPVMFARADGQFQGQFPSAGGTYALLTEDVMVTGPGRGPKEISADDVKTKDRIATFGGLRILVNGPIAYMQSEKNLSAFNRARYLELSRQRNSLKQQQDKIEKQLKGMDKDTPQSKQLQEDLRNIEAEVGEISQQLKDCYLWTVECEYPYSMIMAGSVLFTGGEDKVAAFSTKDGKEIWTAPVTGTAYGFSVINGGLYVSTDKGHIHCFRSGIKGKSKVITADINSNPYPQDKLAELYAEAARHIVEQMDIRKGYCLVLDSGEGRLAYELARLTDLQIIGVEKDANKVAAARKAIDKAGLYGRVVIHQGSFEKLPYTKYFANLIVSDEALRISKPPSWHQEVFELARPYGGVVALGLPANRQNKSSLKKWFRKSTADWKVNESKNIIWAFANRGKPEGAGEWTHLHAEPGNTACSKDELVKGEMAIQWFGRPGPEKMIDRHHRNVPPLFKDGRLFVPGDCIVFAVDAYNGTILWETEIPNSRRLGVFLDSGSMAVDKQYLYVGAEDKCLGFDVQTGRQRLTYTMPQLIKDEPHEWGYIAYSGSILFGSGCKKGASYSETSYDADIALWHRNMKLVTSDYLFAMNKDNGRPLWDYKDGLILNTTITVADNRMYFVETHSPKALTDKVGRMPVKTLFDGGDQYLVSFDTRTGRVVYKKEIDVSNFEEPVYLNYAKEILLLSGSKLVGNSIRYYYNAFDARSGEDCWEVSHDSGLAKDGGHGEYNRHPTIIDDIVYAWPYAYNLKTGEKAAGWIFDRRGHGCGGVSASAQCMFWRGGNPWMYDLGPNGGPTRLNTVTRPGCWINIIPAGGLVLIPEASSGCTCGFAMQTSMAYIPVETLNSKSGTE